MAPSRGWYRILQTPFHSSRSLVRKYSNFARATIDSANVTQVYISRSLDPYLNLSIEHYLLQKTPPDSTVLFLYTNRPCIVLGRNQNPWFEVNLGLLRHGQLKIDLVRRRSGGGTVFHDEGNVNYSVICPPPAFDRDTHAHMVVRALQKLGIEKAKVNERHDIVMDKVVDGEDKTFKVSGSAYKLVRQRSLHHGTCLLTSPNLPVIGQYLRSKAKPYIETRGVESVSSPITNTGVPSEAFERGVISEFNEMYGNTEVILVGDEEENVPGIAKGFKELKSLDWIYGQTPQFTFSFGDGNRAINTTTASSQVPLGSFISFTARHGEITEFHIRFPGDRIVDFDELRRISASLEGRKIHEIEDWRQFLPGDSEHSQQSHLGSKPQPGIMMNYLFGGTQQ